MTTSAALAAGNIGILIIAKDNVATADGDFSEVSSVADSVGNAWVKVREFTNGQGAAAAGVTVSVWMTKATKTLPLGGTITITFSASITAKAATAWSFRVGAGNNLVVEAGVDRADDGVDPGPMSLTALANIEHLFLRGIGGENPSAAFTATANYTAMTQAATSGGGAATNIRVIGEFRIATLTRDTSDPTWTAADHASVYVALKEVPPVSVSASESILISDTPSFSVSRTASASESIAISDTPSVSIGVPALEASASESIGIADSASTSLSRSASVSESLPFSDSIITSLRRTQSLTEGIGTLSEVTSITMTRSTGITEPTISFSDLPSGAKLVSPQLSESVGFSDLVSLNVARSLSLSELVPISDSASFSLRKTVSASESISVSDTPSASVGVPALQASASETISISDSALSSGVRPISASESIALSDSASFNLRRIASVSETISMSDLPSPSLTGAPLLASASESIPVSEGVTLARVSSVKVGETIGAAGAVFVVGVREAITPVRRAVFVV
jgi:hypothetical protein